MYKHFPVLCLAIFLFFCRQAASQIIPIDTALLNRNPSAIDFGFIDKYVADKAIVFLGEDHHACSEYNSLKTGLVQYLHQKHNFNLLLFEDPLDVTYFRYLAKPDLSDSNEKNGAIMWLWRVKENTGLFKMLADPNDSLLAAGMDMFVSTLRADSFAEYRASPFYKTLLKTNHLGAPFLQSFISLDSTANVLIKMAPKVRSVKNTYVNNTYKQAIVSSYTDTLRYTNWKRDLKRVLDRYNAIIDKLPAASTQNEKIINRVIQTRPYALLPFLDENCYDTLRDKIMAENILFYKNTMFPGTKVIVWAHDYHIAKDLVNREGGYNSTAGHFLPKAVQDSSFFISLKMLTHIDAQGIPKTKYAPGHEFTVEYDLAKLGEAYFLPLDKSNVKRYLSKKYKYMYWWNIYDYAYKCNQKFQNQFNAVFFFKNTRHPSYIRSKDGEVIGKLKM